MTRFCWNRPARALECTTCTLVVASNHIGTKAFCWKLENFSQGRLWRIVGVCSNSSLIIVYTSPQLSMTPRLDSPAKKIEKLGPTLKNVYHVQSRFCWNYMPNKRHNEICAICIVILSLSVVFICRKFPQMADYFGYMQLYSCDS